MYHHKLDPWPLPRDKGALYINEPWMIDYTLLERSVTSSEPEDEPDNIRIYLPMDLNRSAILRRLDAVIAFFGAASEKNESAYSCVVNEIISELEIYDQVWFVRHMPKEGKHSREASKLACDIILRLSDIPDACAEKFPFDTMKYLNEEYLGGYMNLSEDMEPVKFDLWNKREYRLHLELVSDPIYGKSDGLDMEPSDKSELFKLAKAEKGISRDILVPGEMNLHALHYTIQRLFGWRNSHLHEFSLSPHDFKQVTNNRFGEYTDLCGVLFRFPNDDFSDLYYDDDYKEGSHYRYWLRKKYTAPFKDYCVADTWPDNRQQIAKFREHFPEFKDEDLLENITEKVDMGGNFNSLTEQLNIEDLFWSNPETYPGYEDWMRDIKIQVSAWEEELEQDTRTAAMMNEAASQLKYWRQVGSYLTDVTWTKPNNYKSTVRGTFGRSYSEMVEESKNAIPYWTEMCSDLFNDWAIIDPDPHFSEIYYQYDFGDDWWIRITVEKVYPVEPDKVLTRPVCVAADGLDLVDDCGRPYGYLDMLRTIHGSDKEEAESMKIWAKSQGWNGVKRTPDKIL